MSSSSYKSLILIAFLCLTFISCSNNTPKHTLIAQLTPGSYPPATIDQRRAATYYLASYELQLPQEWGDKPLKGLLRASGHVQTRQTFDRLTRRFEQQEFFVMEELEESYDEGCTLQRNEDWLHVQCPFGEELFGKDASEGTPPVKLCLKFFGGGAEPREICEEAKQTASGHVRLSARPRSSSWFKDFRGTVLIYGKIERDSPHVTEVHLKYSALDVVG